MPSFAENKVRIQVVVVYVIVFGQERTNTSFVEKPITITAMDTQITNLQDMKLHLGKSVQMAINQTNHPAIAETTQYHKSKVKLTKISTKSSCEAAFKHN